MREEWNVMSQELFFSRLTLFFSQKKSRLTYVKDSFSTCHSRNAFERESSFYNVKIWIPDTSFRE
jgi:hypothetical protein